MAAASTREGSARRGKGFVKKRVQEYLDRINNVEDQIATAKGAHAKKCRSLREDIDGIYEEAENAGVPKKVLKAKIKKAQLKQKADNVRESLDSEDQDDFDQLELALGDLDDDDDDGRKPAAGESRSVAH